MRKSLNESFMALFMINLNWDILTKIFISQIAVGMCEVNPRESVYIV